MQNERIKTEKHIEYDSDDTPDSGKISKLLKIVYYLLNIFC